jgi:hypothetical protein
MEYKIFLGYLAIVIEIISYAIYFWGIWKGKTKPHAFTWLVWGTLNVVGFAAVLTSGGETVAWVLGINALANLAISAIGFWQRNVHYDKYDWLALMGGFLGIFLWWLADNPLYAVILVSISDVIALVPTFRKAYRLPFEENITSFVVGIPYYVLAIIALASFTFTNILYPAAIIAVDGSLVAIIYIRRKKLINVKS